MFLRLSDFHLSGIIILVFSKQKGLTLVFRNDPVDAVKVSSTFDSIPAIQRFLQAEIERLLKDLMREEVPAIIHKLSLEWAMRHQADECLSPASLTNTESDPSLSGQNYPYSIDMDLNDPLRPIFALSNIRRLSQLSLAQHTLSPFTPSVPQSAFRSSTPLIASSKFGLPKRPEFPFSRVPGSELLNGRNTLTSPPESIHSAQSTDPLIRPTLYSHRHRSSNLRRPHPPKRKVVRLRAERIINAQDASSDATPSEQGDYFSEPGGYLPPFDVAHEDDISKTRYEQSWRPPTTFPAEPWRKGDIPKWNDNAWPSQKPIATRALERASEN
jgi:mitochondrial distribution and morphology protein 34